VVVWTQQPPLMTVAFYCNASLSRRGSFFHWLANPLFPILTSAPGHAAVDRGATAWVMRGRCGISRQVGGDG
jgi:hypothetical protein